MADKLTTLPQMREAVEESKLYTDAESNRAKAEEQRLEDLFTAPTQEAVDNWLNAHPEATTTVQDGSITMAKLAPAVAEDVSSIDDLKSAVSNNYGDTQVIFNYGSLNTSTGVIILSPLTTNRLVSNIIKKGLFNYIVSTSSAIYLYIAYYDSSKEFVKAVGWKTTSYELEDYPYIAVVCKNGNAGTDVFPSTEIPVYLSTYSSVPSVADVAADVADIQSVLETKIGFDNEEHKTYLDRENEGTYGNQALANTRRWFFDKIIPRGSYIEKLTFNVNRSTQERIVYVEIWEKQDNTLTKVKTVSVDITAPTVQAITEKHTAILDYTATKDCIVSVLCAVNSIIYTQLVGATNTMLVSTDVSTSTTTLAYSTLTVWNIDVSATLYYSIHAKVNIVLIGPGMDYEEIQDALNDISDDSVTNPYTLLVMPRGTPYAPFSMLRGSWSASYPWSNISPRYISIIGVDKWHCVIRSDSGNYKLPCGEPMTNGIIKNLTFIMTNDDQDPAATQGGYCLHIDCRTKDDVGYNMAIEDCEFEDASGPCLGIGMHKNCALTIRRCNFKTTLAANYAPHEGYRNLVNYGVIFCHSSTLADSTNQRVSFEDCLGVCEEGSTSLWLAAAGEYDPSTASFYYRLLRNVFWNETQNAPAYAIGSTLTADPMNFGNNIP